MRLGQLISLLPFFLANSVHAEEKILQQGPNKLVVQLKDDRPVSSSKYAPSGKLLDRRHLCEEGWANLLMEESGHVIVLTCYPCVRDDAEMREVCGFAGARTTAIYDHSGNVRRRETWSNGALQKTEAGASAGESVAYVDGKKHGEERVVGGGKLRAVVHWNHGVKDGAETEYAKDGAKIAKQTTWRAGQPVEITEFYLNGNRKLHVFHTSEDQKTEQTFWDTGKVQGEAKYLRCMRGYPDWCADGTQRSFYEDGKPESEASWRRGSREGTSKHWYENGKQSSVETWEADRRTKSTRWKESGELIADEEYEADGSRKLKR